jgi:formylglycine-generating enzyme required for sulfatase activity
MRRLLFVLFVVFASPFLWNCSENDTPALVDHSQPEVRIAYPYDSSPSTFVVMDSINVYLVARDIGANGQPATPAKVELWFSSPRIANRVRIGTANPVSIDAVPADIRPFIDVPTGWSLYTRKWYTGPTPLPPLSTPINTGTRVQLFAIAYDAADNAGRTPDIIPIQVTNLGDNNVGPIPRFTVSPQSGTTADTFVFDASETTDRIDSIDVIRVRWDFDGNPSNGWDIDWSRDARADEPQAWQYTTPRVYRAILQVRNSYIPDSVNTAYRDVGVTPIGGNPRPPEPDNYREIPAGDYIMGDSSYVADGQHYQTDAIERPVHPVRISSSYLIEKTEVTNRLYLSYLVKVFAADSAEYRDGIVYSKDPLHPDAPQDVYFDPTLSAIFYNRDTQAFAVRAGFEDHPVTGVTWFGAYGYALEFGLRLPTEAEWEIAARGANADWNYPFAGGVELTATEGPRRVNYAGSRTGTDPFVGLTTPRGFFDGRVYLGFQTQDTPSAFGTYDMAGNVSEWVGDWLSPYSGGLEIDPQGALRGTHRIVRGGSFLSSRVGVRCTSRMGLLPDKGFVSVGFRTAYIRPAPGFGR